MSLPKIITIDGPAASGKSTLGKRIADALGYLFFDTGVMYRAVTWTALSRDIDINLKHLIEQLAEKIDIDVRPATIDDGRVADILADGEDITWHIRNPEVDAVVSQVSTYPGVRKALSSQQRRIGLRGKVVMVGRDIGTIVLPGAEFKIYLEASVEERAKRRYSECMARGEMVNYKEILESMRRRDQIDSTRDIAPLKPAHDAIILDSDRLSADQVYEQSLILMEESTKKITH
ncbi:MAG: (d)CMP kinase [Chloroflexota bacterium]|nr:(d)CMP kinase [Chloroflexota bacterium]